MYPLLLICVYKPFIFSKTWKLVFQMTLPQYQGELVPLFSMSLNLEKSFWAIQNNFLKKKYQYTRTARKPYQRYVVFYSNYTYHFSFKLNIYARCALSTAFQHSQFWATLKIVIMFEKLPLWNLKNPLEKRIFHFQQVFNIFGTFEKLPPNFREIATQLSRNCHPTFEKLPLWVFPERLSRNCHFGFSPKAACRLGGRAFSKMGRFCRIRRIGMPGGPTVKVGPARAVAASTLQEGLEKLPLSKAYKRKSWFFTPTLFFAGEFRETATFKSL